ncbi:MAG: ribosomal RNA small subunit methyltransferase H [Anaerolineae bacterium SM23_ 63]|nr:MAG: ribosomal RNA small subunit methyltransferase H [Anaerolineae bacterium SM23_ 63]HEY47585.1 16S rRNA (cytosine(1402)-N(4))-methyltransferase RsmH [Anaerolineae bacterium]
MSASVDDAHVRGHTPVLYQRVLHALRPGAGGRYIDGTIGAGGHSLGILEASSPDGQVLGIDLDPAALELVQDRLAEFEDRVHLRHGSYRDLAVFADELGWKTADGLLLDLGVSSMVLEDAKRGFSFRLDGPLDMRFDPTQATTAADLVNGLPEGELADLIVRYGEEPRARRVARAIVKARPLHTTHELAELITRVVKGGRRKIHPATRTFQALRIAVNDELNALVEGLEQAIDRIAPGGRIAVISFHSLEDRLVKRIYRRESADCICPPDQVVCTCDHQARLQVITKRPLRPDISELEANPRSRSARLRVAERIELA